ncbi:MAG: hypothetical protein KDA84_03320 [Planctomycetaceae bacterium]|nr:hypothetical protein [Planctomycetaceae bacterium]
METDRHLPLTAFLHNRWFQGVLWICGGCLWLGAFSKSPRADFTPESFPKLQQTQIDGPNRFAWIDGQKVQTGQLLRIRHGVYRVKRIDPGVVVLSQGNRRIKLELPKPGSFEKSTFPSSVAGW